MRSFLYVVWLACLALGLFCITLFLQGLMRDHRTGQPDIAIDLSSPSSSASRHFRIWQGGEYDLLLSSVNHSPPFGTPFKGELEISLAAPGGRELVRRVVDSSSAHARPNNMSWTPIDSLGLERQLRSKSRLTARVIRPDSQFRGVVTRVHLRRRQYDPGMGGLANYVMLFPGILFIAVSFATSLAISQRHEGGKPLWITIATTAILGAIGLAL